jgi:hypothetical protein
MRRGHPDLILDSCSVRAKRGGDLTSPNPTDRGKRGTKTTSPPTGTACRSPASPPRRTSATRLPLSGCSWPLSRSWPASVPCLQIKDMTKTIANCAAASTSSPRSMNAVGRAGRDQNSSAGRSNAATPGSWRTDAWLCAILGSALLSNRCCKALAYSWLRGGLHANSENCFLGMR